MSEKLPPRCHEPQCPFYGLDEGGMVGIIDPRNPKGVCHRVGQDEFNRVGAMGDAVNLIMHLMMGKNCMESQSSVEGNDSSPSE